MSGRGAKPRSARVKASGARYEVRRVKGIGVEEGVGLNALAAGRGTPAQAQEARAHILWLTRRRAGDVGDTIRAAHDVLPGCRLPAPERAVELGEEICARQAEAWGPALDGSDNAWLPVLPLSLSLLRLRALERRAAKIIERAQRQSPRSADL